MSVTEEYGKARRNLLARVRRLEKKGVTVDRGKVIPPKPKRLTAGSVSRLDRLTAERIARMSGGPKARKAVAAKPVVAKTNVKKNIPIKRTRTDEFNAAWEKELKRVEKSAAKLERSGGIRKGVNIREEFPAPLNVSPAKLRALRNITSGKLSVMFPPPEKPRTVVSRMKRRSALKPQSEKTPYEKEKEKKAKERKKRKPYAPRVRKSTKKEFNPDDGIITEGGRTRPWEEIRAEIFADVPGAVDDNGIVYNPETGELLGLENPGYAQTRGKTIIDQRTGKIVWHSPRWRKRLVSAGGIVYNPKTGEVVLISDEAVKRYGVMIGDDDRFILNENGGLTDTRTGEWIYDGEVRVSDETSAAEVSGNGTEQTGPEEKKKESKGLKRLRYNPEEDTVEEVPDWEDDEDFIVYGADESIAGMTETDRMIYEIMHDETLPHDYARIQELLKHTRSRPERMIGESYKEYLDRLAMNVRVRAYQDELGNYPERDTGETQEDYLIRLSRLVEATGRPTLTQMEERKENAIRAALEKRLGYDPFKPVTDSDRVPAEMVLNYILQHWDIVKGNLPRGFSYYGKPNEIGIRLALERMDERSRRNFYYARKAAVARDAERRKKYTKPDDLPPMSAADAITERFESLVRQFRGTDIEEQSKNLLRMWEQVKEREGKNIEAFLRENGAALTQAIDNMIPEWWQYHISGEEGVIGMFTLPDTDVVTILRGNRPLSLSELHHSGSPVGKPVRGYAYL